MGYPAHNMTTNEFHGFTTVQEYLSHCVAAVREHGGFVSKQVAADRGLVSTAEAARDRFYAGRPFTIEDGVTASRIIDWAASSLPNADNDFLRNLNKSMFYAAREGVSHRNFAMVAASVTAYERATNQRISKAATPKNAVDCDATRIVELFKTAYAYGAKRRPKIVLETSNGMPVMFAPAPPSGRNAGCVYVSNGEAEPANVYYGKITPNGKFEPAKACSDEIRDLIVALAKDPVGVARAYGLATKYCCFCAAELTAGESQAVGYGPICAEKYGLPWGEVTVSTKVVVDLPTTK